jgi:pimeloyl-ACP methyl ester carboxylesterase/class 3 adenylate cyclase
MNRNMGRPRTRYAKSGDVNIAYQVMGNGPLDLIVAPGWLSNVDMHWQMLGYEAWVARMTSFCRLIVFDKRGGGLSDRDVGDSTLEERMDDLRAVLDAASSERAAVLGFSEGGSLAMLFAASYPQRVHALILFGTFPCTRAASDFPEGESISVPVNEMARLANEEWGEGKTLSYIAPSLAHVPAAVEFMGRFERASLSPRAARASMKWISEIDVREVARTLHVPTLVMHRADDQLIPIVGGRWLGNNITGARFVELPGNDHAPWFGDFQLLAAEVEELLTGSRGLSEIDRVLATVLFTDIVGSTERAVGLGDRGWQDLLRRHHALVREELRRHRGVEQDTAGDGFFATFDGPARAVRCAQRICEGVREMGLEVRAGVHTGECERDGERLGGIAVHIGARVMAQAQPGEVLVSSTVRDLVGGSGLTFAERGAHTLKGIPGEWALYAASA